MTTALRQGAGGSNPKSMGDRKPSDDLKEGLFLLFRAARGMARDLDTSKVEKTVSETVSGGAKELVRVINNVGKTLSNELEKTFGDEQEGKAPGAPQGDHGPAWQAVRPRAARRQGRRPGVTLDPAPGARESRRVHPAFRLARRSLLTLGVLAAVVGSFPAPQAQAEAPAALDPDLRPRPGPARPRGLGGIRRCESCGAGGTRAIRRRSRRRLPPSSATRPWRRPSGPTQGCGGLRPPTQGRSEGSKRRIKALGFVDHWLIAGPFDNEAKASLNTPFGPEEDLRAPMAAGKTYEGKERPVAWRSIPDVASYGWLDLGNAVRPSEKVCVYATTFVAPGLRAGRQRRRQTRRQLGSRTGRQTGRRTGRQTPRRRSEGR